MYQRQLTTTGQELSAGRPLAACEPFLGDDDSSGSQEGDDGHRRCMPINPLNAFQLFSQTAVRVRAHQTARPEPTAGPPSAPGR